MTVHLDHAIVPSHTRDASARRLAALLVAGPFDNQINHEYGGSLVYWNEPDGHQWEILTVSYARQ